MQSFKIGSKTVGQKAKCFVIGEVALAHDGSLGAAHAFIDVIADAGADAVKFQMHIAEAEGTTEEKFRVKIFPQDATRQDYWRRTSFTEEQWRGLKEHTDKRELIFLSSPFSVEALYLLLKIGVAAWKVGSGETSNLPLLEAIADTKLPVLLSTGMSTWKEVDEAVYFFKSKKTPLLLYQCTNRYPCPPEHLGLNIIAEYQKRYEIPVGLSDHSGKVCAGIAAHALGACSLEVHVTFHRKCFGPDVPASLTPEELKELVDSIRFLERAYTNPVNKEKEAADLENVRALFMKSIVPSRDLSKGSVLQASDLSYKKPAKGIPAKDYTQLIGKKIKRDIQKDKFLSWEDIEET